MDSFWSKVAKVVFFPITIAVKLYMWACKRQEKRNEVAYVKTSSGFLYRLLDAQVDDGYDAVVAQLLPGERLYRMMDGAWSVSGRPSPILMKDRINFDQSVEAMSTCRWTFKLAAGIPAVSERQPDPIAKIEPLGRRR